MDPNDKTIVSLQPDVSPGRYKLTLQANETNLEICSAKQYFKNPNNNPFQSSSLLAIRTRSIVFAIEMFLHSVLRGYFYISSNLMVIYDAKTKFGLNQ